jgi:hypothetical protein
VQAFSITGISIDFCHFQKLKVQPLPSDEPVVIDGAVLTPPLQRKVSDSRNSPLRDCHFNSREQSPAQISNLIQNIDSPLILYLT